MTTRRFARRAELGLAPAQFALLERLDTPQKIQAYLYGLKQNFEVGGDTCRPVRAVLQSGAAHCIEGAMLAACALWVHGEKNVWCVGDALDELRHFPLLNGYNLKALARRDPFERRVGGLLQYRRPRK